MEGAVTSDYKGDRETVVRVLNQALATEIVCVLRYKRHHYTAKGIHSQGIAEEFLEHANEEQGHADQIAERITQLGGAPNFSPEGMLTRSHSEYVEGETLFDMIREDLVAEPLLRSANSTQCCRTKRLGLADEALARKATVPALVIPPFGGLISVPVLFGCW